MVDAGELIILALIGTTIGVLLMLVIDTLSHNYASSNPYIKLLRNPEQHSYGVDYPDNYNIKTDFSLDSVQYNSLYQFSDSFNEEKAEEDGVIIEVSDSEKEEKIVMVYDSLDRFRNRVEVMKEIKQERDGTVLDPSNLLMGTSEACWGCHRTEPMFRTERVDRIYKINDYISYCGTTRPKRLCCDCMVELYHQLVEDDSIETLNTVEELANRI